MSLCIVVDRKHVGLMCSCSSRQQ